MLDPTILMRRSLRWVLEQHDIAPEAWTTMPTNAQQHLEELVIAVADDMRYNALKYFRPFEHQKSFFTTTTDRRGILAANRIGKTVSTCYETAYHLTGEYPDWWQGHKFDKPITVMVAGEGWSQVALVLQQELLGTPDVKLREQIGTGAIPRDAIVQDTMRGDGANCIGVEIRHKSGGKSYLLFANYTQEVRQLQGFKLNLAVFDEQPPDDFFSEIVTRTATTQGMVLCSFTPLKGLNGLVSKFWNREAGYDYVRVSWDDVPEYDPWGEPFLLAETRRQLERDYLPHEREARMQGKPIQGKGAVFQIRDWPTYKTGDYDFRSMPNLHRIIALDLGLVNDKTVISLVYWDPWEKTAWLHKQITVQGVEEAVPTQYVNHLLRPEVFGTPIVLPPDASTPGRYTMSANSIRELFENYELNVLPKPIMNPPDSEGRITNHKSYGINQMRQMLEVGSLMVNENCTGFLNEARNYYVDAQGRFSDPDDCIDSARYAILGCLNGFAEPWDNRTPQQRMAAQRDRYVRRDESQLPAWKKSYNPAA
ncbi:Terminase RNaseH-like domain containing protein [uncultured Caudovirales phage]|uniref:Terminase RNaseH-like domain containing protein n=1 Tax=uncultured Caudovirales phage TaxID=2100421 RepID=A0A6J5P5A9_9CAUD|nr:Terminase RNaseH-like domain containing protein [uncultured Caudovirales phage]